MTFLLSLIAALLGAGLGFLAGAAAAAALAPLLGISSFEGASGYFAVFIGGPLGALLGLVIGPVLVLRWRGHRGFSAIAGRLALAVAGVVVLAGTALAVFWWMRPIVNPNGLPPQLAFEIRLPPNVAAPDPREGFLELQTSENRMPANSVKLGDDQGRPLVTGQVELYYRTSDRILVLTMPDKTDILFTLRLGRSPARTKAFGDWIAASYIAEPGKEQPRKATAGDRYEIRYRVDWPGDD